MFENKLFQVYVRYRFLIFQKESHKGIFQILQSEKWCVKNLEPSILDLTGTSE